MQSYFLVGIGGAVGSMLRFGLGEWTKQFAFGQWPLGTWIANILGCTLIGILVGYFATQMNSEAEQNYRLLLVTGFCGGFTTFSTFSLESLQLLRSGHIGLAVTYMLSTVLFCLMGVALGNSLIQSS